jgi:hypothetical protein
MKRFIAPTLLLLASAFACQAGIILEGPPTAALGTEFTIDVIAEGINLGGYDLTIEYTPLLAAAAGSVEFGTALGFTIQPEPEFGLAHIRFSETSLEDTPALLAMQGTGPDNRFRIASISFLAAAAGAAQFNVTINELTDVNANPFTSTAIGTVVQIVPPTPPSGVPEPGTWAMMAAGLSLIALNGRRLLRPASRHASERGER